MMSAWFLGLWTLVGSLLPASPWQDWALWELQARQALPLTALPLRPFNLDEVTWKDSSSPWVRVLEDRLESWWQRGRKIVLRPYLHTQGDTLQWQEIYIWGTFRFTALTMDFSPMVRIGDARGYPWSQWHGWLSGEFLTAVGTLAFPPLSVVIGRTPIQWGAGRTPLTFNTEAIPLDILMVRYRNSGFQAWFGVTALDPWRVREEDVMSQPSLTVGDWVQRYLSFHRLEFFLLQDRLKVGLSENILYGGVHALPQPHYLNPFYFFYLGWLNRGGGVQENVSFDVDLHYRFGSQTLVFGEFYLDDVQYEPPSTKEPHQIGFQIGAVHARGPWFFYMTYTRVNAWTYLHEGNWQDWIAYRTPLGHPYGPDFDEVFLRGTRHLTQTWDLSVEFAYRRKGENTISTPWPIGQGGWDAFPPGSAFLWGTVEYRTRVVAEVQGFTPGFHLLFRVGVDDLRNAGHRARKHRRIPWAYVEARVPFRWRSK